MILFTFLVLITLIIAIIATVILGIGGTLGIIVFGDVIVCIIVVFLIIRKRIKKGINKLRKKEF